MEAMVEKWRKRTEEGFDEIIREAASDLSRAGMGECPIGNRILEIIVDGEPIDMNRKYRIVTNNFLTAGGGEYGIFKEGEEIVKTDVDIRDVIADYVRKNSPVDAKVEGRIVEIK